jgi:hypothetical protein
VPISHTLKEQVNALGEKMNMGKSMNTYSTGNSKHAISQSLEADPVLRAGDQFRLRSMKFPDYELGVTSVKLKDDFCYLGLRKVESNGEKVKAEEWCMPVRFSVRSGSVFK